MELAKTYLEKQLNYKMFYEVSAWNGTGVSTFIYYDL